MSEARITPSTGHAGEHHHAAWEGDHIRTGGVCPIVRGDGHHPHIAGQRHEHRVHDYGAREADDDELGREVALQHAAEYRADGRCSAGDQTDDAEHRAALFKRRFSRMMLVMSDKEMPVPSDMTSRAASSIGKLTASAPSSVPAAKITTAMMNRVLVANLRTMNGELEIDTDSKSR